MKNYTELGTNSFVLKCLQTLHALCTKKIFGSIRNTHLRQSSFLSGAPSLCSNSIGKPRLGKNVISEYNLKWAGKYKRKNFLPFCLYLLECLHVRNESVQFRKFELRLKFLTWISWTSNLMIVEQFVRNSNEARMWSIIVFQFRNESLIVFLWLGILLVRFTVVQS